MQYKRYLYIALGTLVILLIPLFGTQFVEGWDWTLSDFVIMGAMLFITGSLIDLSVRKLGKYGFIVAAVIVFLFLWLWVELAVGLFTNWGS